MPSNVRSRRTVVIAPDSYKGTLSASSAAEALAAGWREMRPDDELISLPMADGGEGTLDAVEAAVDGARRHVVARATGPDGRPVDASWLSLPDASALVELAGVSGLPLMSELDPLGATTRGLGQVLAAVCEAGSPRVLIALGGSASSDGGTGALRELGLELLGADGTPLAEGGGALADLAAIDGHRLRPPPVHGVEVLTDVDNPLVGTNGAASVFGPQKGAGDIEIRRIDAGLTRLAQLAGGSPDAAGAGAAGGAGYGFATFWGASLSSGSRVIGEIVGLPSALDRASLVLTGEGAFDATSLGGKCVGHVLDLAGQRDVPVGVVAGLTRTTTPTTWRLVSLSELAGSTGRSMSEPARWLKQAGRTLAGDAATLW